MAPAAQLLGHDTRPSEAAIRAKRKIRLQEALNRMDPLDREVLALRPFASLRAWEQPRALPPPFALLRACPTGTRFATARRWASVVNQPEQQGLTPC
jgi:hypothetical protein